MAKLTAQQLEQLAPYGLTPKTEEDAKKEVRKILEANDLTDLDDEDLPTLLNFLEAFPADAKPAKKAKAAAEEEDDDADTPPAPKKAKKAEEAEEPVPKKKKPATADEDNDALADEVKKSKKDAPKADKEKAPAKDKAKTGRKPANGNIFDKNNEEHVAAMTKKFGKLLPSKQYNLTPIVTGFTVRYLGENAKIVILKYSNVRIDEKGHFIGDLNFKKIKDVEELKKLLPDTLEDKGVEKVSGRNYTRINDLTDTEFAGLLQDEDVMASILKKAKTIDTKMGTSREKMEASLSENGAPKKAPKPTQKEDDDEPAPVKKAAKKPVEEDDEPAPAPKKKKPVVVEEEDDAPPPPKKKKPVVEEED